MPWGIFQVESHRQLKNWHSNGCPATHVASKGQCWDWSAPCRYTVGQIESFISVWQHVKLSEHIHPLDTLSCCWEVNNQQTNKPCVPPWPTYFVSVLKPSPGLLRLCTQAISCDFNPATRNWNKTRKWPIPSYFLKKFYRVPPTQPPLYPFFSGMKN